MSQGYYSGGGGYVLSKKALELFGKRPPNACSKDRGAEDVEIGMCMMSLHVKTGDSRDVLGRSRFHCFTPLLHITGSYPEWYYAYDAHGAKKVGVWYVQAYLIFKLNRISVCRYLLPESMISKLEQKASLNFRRKV